MQLTHVLQCILKQNNVDDAFKIKIETRINKIFYLLDFEIQDNLQRPFLNSWQNDLMLIPDSFIFEPIT